MGIAGQGNAASRQAVQPGSDVLFLYSTQGYPPKILPAPKDNSILPISGSIQQYPGNIQEKIDNMQTKLKNRVNNKKLGMFCARMPTKSVMHSVKEDRYCTFTTARTNTKLGR
jgi:hypothetical protein